MDTVDSYPEQGAAFEGESAANGEEIFKPQRAFVATVGVEPMVAHADSEANCHPVKEDRDPESRPAEHKEGRDGTDMKSYEGDGGGPVEPLGTGEIQGFSYKNRRFLCSHCN